MGEMFSKRFWLDTAQRTIRTFAQAFVSYSGAGLLNVVTFNWLDAGAISAGAAVLCVMTCLIASKSGDDSASFGKHEA